MRRWMLTLILLCPFWLIAAEVPDITAQDVIDLPAYKVARNLAVDVQSVALIGDGFTHESKVFSLSERAQAKLMELRIGILAGDIVDGAPHFPKSVSAIDDTKYALVDTADAGVFVKAGFDRMDAVLTAGTDLKQSVLDAADQPAVDAVTDSRA